MIFRNGDGVRNHAFLDVRMIQTLQRRSGEHRVCRTHVGIVRPALLEAFDNVDDRRSRIDQILNDDRGSSFNFSDDMRDNRFVVSGSFF